MNFNLKSIRSLKKNFVSLGTRPFVCFPSVFYFYVKYFAVLEILPGTSVVSKRMSMRYP